MNLTADQSEWLRLKRAEFAERSRRVDEFVLGLKASGSLKRLRPSPPERIGDFEEYLGEARERGMDGGGNS